MDTTEETVFHLTVNTRDQMVSGRIVYDRVARIYIYVIEKTNLTDHNPPTITEAGQGTEVAGMINSIMAEVIKAAQSAMQTRQMQ